MHGNQHNKEQRGQQAGETEQEEGKLLLYVVCPLDGVAISSEYCNAADCSITGSNISHARNTSRPTALWMEAT